MTRRHRTFQYSPTPVDHDLKKLKPSSVLYARSGQISSDAMLSAHKRKLAYELSKRSRGCLKTGGMKKTLQ